MCSYHLIHAHSELSKLALSSEIHMNICEGLFEKVWFISL